MAMSPDTPRDVIERLRSISSSNSNLHDGERKDVLAAIELISHLADQSDSRSDSAEFRVLERENERLREKLRKTEEYRDLAESDLSIAMLARTLHPRERKDLELAADLLMERGAVGKNVADTIQRLLKRTSKIDEAN